MRFGTGFWHWTGTLVGVCATVLAVSALQVKSQDLPAERPAAGPVGPDAPDADPQGPAASPDAPTPSARPSVPSSRPGAPNVTRRTLEADPDAFGQLVRGPSTPGHTVPAAARVEPPHPLAAAYPHHHVVVCVAGCRPAGAGIVYIATHAQPATGPTAPSPIVQASAMGRPVVPALAPAVTSGPPVIECLAGCNRLPKTYAAPSTLGAQAAAPAPPPRRAEIDATGARPRTTSAAQRRSAAAARFSRMSKSVGPALLATGRR